MRETRVGTFLLWLVLTVSIPMLLLTVGVMWHLQEVQRRQQQTALIDLAREASQMVDQRLERLADGLLGLAGSTALERSDLQAFGHEAGLTSARLGGVPISLATLSGRVLLRAGDVRPEPNAAEASVRQTAQTAIRTGMPVITNFLPVNQPTRREIEVAVPVPRIGETTAERVLVGEIDSAWLGRLAATLPAGPSGLVMTILDRDGLTVVGSGPGWQPVDEPARPGWRQAIQDRRSGLLADQATLAGGPVIQAFSIARLSGYGVVARQPRDAFGAAIEPDLMRTLLIGAALLIVGLVAAWCLARRLVGALRGVPERDPAGGPSGLREVDQLTAKLRVALEACDASKITLRANEGQLRDLLGMLDLAAIVVREMDGTIRFWSLGCTRLYGWSRAEAVGRSCHELLSTQFPVPAGQIEQAVLTRGEWTGDLVHRRRDGSLMVVSAHTVLRRDFEAHAPMVMESLVDVTALREAQDGLRRLDQDLEQRVRSEMSAREAVQRRAEYEHRIRALGALAGGIAHDFNNVLQVVAGGAALLARRPHDADAVGRLGQVISDAAVRGAAITRRMLALARRDVLQSEPIEPMVLLTATQGVFAASLGARIDVQLQIVPGLPRLLADKARLETALLNLGTNARDAMPDGGTLRLTASLEAVMPADAARHAGGLRSGIYVRLSVEDDGAGMSPATLARVGEPFFTTKDVGEGTGLGLSMVKGFAEHSGGGFAIESAIGVGTTAVLWLPVVPGDGWTTAGPGAGAAGMRRSGQILLVDDDRLVLDALTEQLEGLGHRVLATSGGCHALAILQAREAVDLLITDLAMPGMNGLALIEQARELRPSLPVILLTGNPREIAAIETAGDPRCAELVMRKPATSAMLGARVSALLQRA
ncbi:ATP-binding protein [Rhodopila sp.]|uniref:ATP-binding protein n=1 Tax=Rhodopila sp. TaxID=2480087 RepID=UPI003D138678